MQKITLFIYWNRIAYERCREENIGSGPQLHKRVPQPILIASSIILIIPVVGGFISVYVLTGRSQLSVTIPEEGNNFFYVETPPAWGSTSIDGRVLPRVPVRGIDPFRTDTLLRHLLHWLPWQRLVCSN